MSARWLIWSIEHQAWWRASHGGYTVDRKLAGLYDYNEAVEIVRDANRGHEDVPNEAMVLCDEVTPL